MATPKNLNELPSEGKVYFIFRLVSGLMTCETYTNIKDLETKLFELEYEKKDYKLFQANSMSVHVNINMFEKHSSATRKYEEDCSR